jgi:hypothetical protein
MGLKCSARRKLSVVVVTRGVLQRDNFRGIIKRASYFVMRLRPALYMVIEVPAEGTAVLPSGGVGGRR